jgi:hypothetical protein
VFATKLEKVEAKLLIEFYGGNITNAETQANDAGKSGALVELVATSGVGATGGHIEAEGSWVVTG